jgi:hypothetical protein
VEARYQGRALRIRDAIEQTSVVVTGALVEPGTPSPGPPGAHRIDDATFRIDSALTPGASSASSQTVKLSYLRQVFPESEAEAPLEPGQRYVLFCIEMGSNGGLSVIKIVPQSDETLRVVANAFQAGARHGRAESGERMA